MQIQFIVNVDDLGATEITNALCGNYAYQSTLDDGTPNPATPQDFVVQVVENFFREEISRYKLTVKQVEARAAVATEVEAIPINITLGSTV